VIIKTKVYFHKTFERQLDSVPDYIRVKVMTWIHLVEQFGIREVSKSKGFHDEPLKGIRKGQRSVRMNRSYRLIYTFKNNSLDIILIEVNKHEY
jgi:proteic killer suppression protein